MVIFYGFFVLLFVTVETCHSFTYLYVRVSTLTPFSKLNGEQVFLAVIKLL